MFRTITKIACLSLIALPLASAAFAGTGGPNPPQMTGHTISRAASWQENPWADMQSGVMGRGKMMRSSNPMCEKIRAEYQSLESEDDRHSE